MADPSPAPPGAFVELNLSLIDEGRLTQQAESQLRAALKELLQYEQETGDRMGKAVVQLKITLERASGTSEFFDLSYTTAKQVPNVIRATTVKEAQGRLICQPSGSNEGDPDQQLFFDRNGRVIGGVNTETGEVVEPAVAGKIGRKAQG